MVQEREVVYMFDRPSQAVLETIQNLRQSQRLLVVSSDGETQSNSAFRFANANESQLLPSWKSLLRSDGWSRVLYRCPLKNCVMTVPNNYVEAFNGPTKIGRLNYKGTEVLLLADFHGSQTNMCDSRSARAAAVADSRSASSSKKPRMEEWVNRFVQASNDKHCPTIDVVLEAMDAELETGAPYPLDRAVNHFSVCLEQQDRPSVCGKHRFHKIDIRHGKRFPSIADFEVVIDSFYGRSSTSVSRQKSIDVWRRIFDDLVPVYQDPANASRVVNTLLQREPGLVAQMQSITDNAEREKLLRWLTRKIAAMPNNFLNIEASLPHVLGLYESNYSYGEFAKRADALRERPLSSLMHAALYLSVLLVDFYALSCMLRMYDDTKSRPTHVVAYIGFHHFDNYVDYFGVASEIVGRSGSEQRCETCASLTQPFLVPKHNIDQITIMIPSSLLQKVASGGPVVAATNANRFAPTFDDLGPEPSFQNIKYTPEVYPSYGSYDILSYARPSRHEQVSEASSASSSVILRRHASDKKSRDRSASKKSRRNRSSRKDKHTSSSSSSSEENSNHGQVRNATKRRSSNKNRKSSKRRASPKHALRLIPRASSPLPHTLRMRPAQLAQQHGAVFNTPIASQLYQLAYPNALL